MAYNDMEVIAYKILKFLYECMKQGITPTKEDLIRECNLDKFPESYWCKVVAELIDKRYIKGFSQLKCKGGTYIQMNDDISVTFDGVRFLEDNSKMKEVKDFLGSAFEIALQQGLNIIKASMPG